MSEIKFCKDCKWVTGADYYYCNRPEVSWLSSGEPMYECKDLRHIESSLSDKSFHCGPEAKYFEPRLTFWQKVKEWLR